MPTPSDPEPPSSPERPPGPERPPTLEQPPGPEQPLGPDRPSGPEQPPGLERPSGPEQPPGLEQPSALDRQVSASLRRAGFAPGTTLVVAASGGPDSTALLRCLHHLRREYRLRLHVAHLNHDFRGAEADHDAAFVQRLADRLGLPASIDKQDPIAYQRQRGISSFEQAAREMRYAFLSAVAASVGAAAIALGHTADDQAETVLLHLLRGSGLHGLRGMSEIAPWPWPQPQPAPRPPSPRETPEAPPSPEPQPGPRLPNLRGTPEVTPWPEPEPQPGPLLFRPLLGASKADTAAYCRALNQPYRQDSGNYMWRFTRNKVRHDLIPRLSRDYNPRVRQALTRLSRAAAEEVDYIENELARHWPAIANENDGAISFNLNALTALHPALRRQALRRAYAAVAGDPRNLSESHLEAMLNLLRQQQGGRALNLPRGVRAQRQAATLLLTRQPAPPTLPELPGEYDITLPPHPGEEITHQIGNWRLTLQTLEPPPPTPHAAPNAPAAAPNPLQLTARTNPYADLAAAEPAHPSPDPAPNPPQLTALLNRDALGATATLRTRRPGDRFQPSGMTGHKKLQDFLTDAKIPRQHRDRIPLLICANGIAWIAGHRTAQWAAPVPDAPTLSISLTPTTPPPANQP